MPLPFVAARGNRGGTFAAAPAAPAAEEETLLNTYSVSCDGTNDYVALGTGPNTAFNDNSGDFTVSIWFNFNANVSYDTLISNGYQVQIYLLSGKIVTYLSKTAGASYFISGAATDTTFSSGTWYHLGIIRSGTSFKYYVGGDEDSSHTGTGETYVSTNELHVGMWSTSSYPFDGKVDEFGLWDTALTAENMTDIYNGGVPTDLSSLSPLGWWRMGDDNGGSGTNMTDQGSGENDGTLTNGAAFGEDVP